MFDWKFSAAVVLFACVVPDFDAGASAQTLNAVTGAMGIPRTAHRATLLNDGRVLVTGGNFANLGSSVTNTAELYDPATGTWRYTLHPMNFPRTYHTATLLSDGRVLIAGGATTSSSTNTAEIFDPSNETFIWLLRWLHQDTATRPSSFPMDASLLWQVGAQVQVSMPYPA